MRSTVVWLTNIPLADVCVELGLDIRGSGFWMDSLLREILALDKFEFHVITTHAISAVQEFERGGVKYYVIPEKLPIDYYFPPKELFSAIGALLQRINPDVIHVHGSERAFGLACATPRWRSRTLVTLQGILLEYRKRPFGALSTLESVGMVLSTDLILGRGVIWQWLMYHVNAQRERKIFQAGFLYGGRTAWDEACLKQQAPSALYTWCGEVLRPSFYNRTWRADRCVVGRIFFSNGADPRRGVEVLLKAVARVSIEYPFVTLRIGGHPPSPKTAYGRFLLHMASKLKLGDRISYLGYLSEHEVATELEASNVFVLPSVLENSPNSLCEAQMVGCPVIASRGGGVPSLVQDGTTGLLFECGNERALAQSISRILADAELSNELSTQGRRTALIRHDPQKVGAALLNTYDSLCVRS